MGEIIIWISYSSFQIAQEHEGNSSIKHILLCDVILW
jgi:hypothetical protein